MNSTSLLTFLFPHPLTTPLFTPPPLLLHNIFAQSANLSLLTFTMLFLKNKKSLLLKPLLLFYSLCQSLWCFYTIRAIDLLLYSLFIGVAVSVSLVLQCRCGFRREKEVEKIYSTLFQPLQISRKQFSKILSCRRKGVRLLKAGEDYAREKVTRVDSLGVVLSGRLLVTQSSRPLHIIHPHQFVDSPEYFGVSTDDLFQVSITAVEDSRLLVWHRDKLRLIINNCNGENIGGGGGGGLREMFDHVIGRDVVRKLVQVSDSSTGVINIEKKHHHLEQTTEECSPLDQANLLLLPPPPPPTTDPDIQELDTEEAGAAAAETWTGSLGKIAEDEDETVV